MENTIGETNIVVDDKQSWTISAESVGYIIILVLALILRLANLDSAPMSPIEAEQAMRAHIVLQGDANNAELADSPLIFALQTISFSLLGANELSSRLFTALGSLLLVLSPLLFRAHLGRAQTFILVIMLAFSPVGLMAARFSASAIWTLLFTMVGLWALWRNVSQPSLVNALYCAVSFSAMLFLSGPAGPLVGIILLISMISATGWQMWAVARGTQDMPMLKPNTFPWAQALLFGSSVIFITSTLLMFYPSGLGMVGQLLETSLGGFATPTPLAPGAYPLFILLFYEPLLIFLGIVGYILRLKSNELTLIDRICALWCFWGGVMALIYAGGRADYALWMTVPLAYLASHAVAQFIANESSSFFWLDNDYVDISDSDYARTLNQAKWWTAVGTFILIIMLAVHLQAIGRDLLTLPSTGDLWPIFTDPSFIGLRYAAIWSIITVLLFLIGFFIIAGFYGSKTTLSGAGLGLFAFMLLSGVGSGWNAVVTNATNPSEPWHTRATSSDAHLLRQTLYDIAERDSRGVPLLDVYVLAQNQTLSSQGIIGWLLRDFPNARYVDSLTEVQRQQIVLLPSDIAEPNLGGAYVGQKFVIAHLWDNSMLQALDFPAWWLQRFIRNLEHPQESVILWLRQDVYNGVPASERP